MVGFEEEYWVSFITSNPMSESIMDMKAKNQYLHTLITQKGGYHLQGRKQRTAILDEYCRITGQNRDYVIRKIKSGSYITTMRTERGETKRARASKYDGDVVAHLIKIWNIFDRPCGQRMVAQIRTELDRLYRFGEILISSDMAEKLKGISSAEIDRSLVAHKEKEHLKAKYQKKIHPLLYQKIPVKIATDQDRTVVGNVQIDMVEHCGQKAEGEYIYTLSTTDLCTNWWQGGAVLTKRMAGVVSMLDVLKSRYPFSWKCFHSDNGTEFINEYLYRYAKEHDLEFSRSRPYEKNDNYLVEQKNGRVVRRHVGYQRHDTKKELGILNEFYVLHGLYQNFFQPVMKVVEKERIGSKIKRTLSKPQTPYQMVMGSEEISGEVKVLLKTQYESLNPAELKRQIDTKRDELYRAYKGKNGQSTKVELFREFGSVSPTFLNDRTEAVSPT